MSNKVVPISDLGEIITGKTPSSNNPEDFGNEVLFITPSDDFDHKYIRTTARYLSSNGVEKLKSKLLPSESVMVTCIGSDMGKLAMNGLPAITNQQINSIVVDKNKYDPSYVYYKLKKSYEVLRQYSTGSTAIPLLNKTDFSNIEITVEDNLSTQQKIAAVLTALDAKIELNARINAELESMAKTLYDYWFVQFKTPSLPPPNTTDDPPSYLGEVPAIAGGGGLVWNEALKREIPLGWEVAELGNFAQPIRGVTYKKDDIKKSSDKNAIPILRATNISNGVIDLNDMVYVPEEVVSEEQYLNKFDVLITMSSGSKAHVGKNAFYYFDQKVSFGAFCSKLSVNKNMRFYVNVQMQSDSFKKYIANVGLGTNINNLTNKHITEYKLLIPPKELLLEYENTVEGFYNRIGNNMKESQTLTELRDWLLPMLMNGQVVVK